ncbi:MAG: hypothetical protein HY216_14675 [Candidatus Rokubacteria bacterium]|nr:hypothetical protein [Candidatus Rokubacteria bacterium]
MRKTVWASLFAVALLLVAAVPSDAWTRHGHHFRSRVFIGVGPAFVVGAPWWYYYPPAPYYVYSPPIIVQEQPPVYVQQQPAPPAVPAPEMFWYYCPGARAYYPDTATCSEPWVKVPARGR